MTEVFTCGWPDPLPSTEMIEALESRYGVEEGRRIAESAACTRPRLYWNDPNTAILRRIRDLYGSPERNFIQDMLNGICDANGDYVFSVIY